MVSLSNSSTEKEVRALVDPKRRSKSWNDGYRWTNHRNAAPDLEPRNFSVSTPSRMEIKKTRHKWTRRQHFHDRTVLLEGHGTLLIERPGEGMPRMRIRACQNEKVHIW
jgi:hypothetical protein